MKRIMIDGMNLALEKGTGVATYSRNLSYLIHDMGYNVSVLYGNRAPSSSSRLLNEIAFFDNGEQKISRMMRILRVIRETLYAPAGFHAKKVHITGDVIRSGFESTLPFFDDIYNASEVFRKANNSFTVFNRLNTVGMEEKPDLMHWTYPIPLKIRRVPNVYTLHDLVPLRLPYTTLDNKRRYLSMVSKIAHSADHIVTVSETSKQDIVKLLGISPDRVTNTYQSVRIPGKYLNKSDADVQREIEGAFGLEYKGYYIFFGSIEPKKNIGRLIEAFLASEVQAPLVIVGAQAWKSGKELRLLDEHIRSCSFSRSRTGSGQRILRLNYAPFNILMSLIKGARATLFPSLYEGFGLPVLESMMLGTPVISSTLSSVPEIAGDAAYLVDPYDTGKISAAINEIDRDEGLRGHLVARGLEQAKLFSEDKYRAALSGVYSKLL